MKSELLERTHSIMRSLVTFLFPTTCVGCNSGDRALCSMCASHIEPSPDAPHSDIHALYNYHDRRLKRLLWNYKFLGQKHLARDLAVLMYGGVLEVVSDTATMQPLDEIVLTSVPGSTARVKARGYDQGVLLRRALTAIDTADIFASEMTLLERAVSSQAQTDIKNREKRIANIRNAFTVDPHHTASLKGRNILLIDDVTTTGATLTEARKTLMLAGARRVLCVSLSH